jgi:hypothetical protein
VRCAQKMTRRGGAGKGSGSKGCRGAEHGQACTLRNALVLWLSGQHLNRPCKSGEATKATGKQKWPTLRNVGIRYSGIQLYTRGHAWGNHGCAVGPVARNITVSAPAASRSRFRVFWFLRLMEVKYWARTLCDAAELASTSNQ